MLMNTQKLGLLREMTIRSDRHGESCSSIDAVVQHGDKLLRTVRMYGRCCRAATSIDTAIMCAALNLLEVQFSSMTGGSLFQELCSVYVQYGKYVRTVKWIPAYTPRTMASSI